MLSAFCRFRVLLGSALFAYVFAGFLVLGSTCGVNFRERVFAFGCLLHLMLFCGVSPRLLFGVVFRARN